jgi:pyruvate dehydrogenase E2 component (dihydrolipoamide acetyltransferase)
MSKIIAVRMPKWGLAMQEGTVVHWWKEPGAAITEGEDLVDIETPKITNVYESPEPGVLRRITAQAGETLPVGALLGVMADASVGEAEIDTFVAEFQANFVPPAQDEAGGGLPLHNIDVGKRTIRVGRTGAENGTPVVMIHGYSGDLHNWQFNMEAIGAEHPVIVFDLPGHGGSSKNVGDGSLQSLSDIVAATLKSLDVSRAHIVGHSLGAAVAARLAVDHADMVQSLTLISPASLPGTTIAAEFLTGIAEGQRARDLKPFLEMLFADPSLVTKDMIEEMVKFKRLDDVETALKTIRDKLVANDDRDALARDLSKIPSATVIASKSDRIVGSPDASKLPGSFKVHWIEGAGHMPHIEKAAEVNDILLGVLRA